MKSGIGVLQANLPISRHFRENWLINSRTLLEGVNEIYALRHTTDLVEIRQRRRLRIMPLNSYDFHKIGLEEDIYLLSDVSGILPVFSAMLMRLQDGK